MKVEFHVGGPATAALLADMAAKYTAATEADTRYWQGLNAAAASAVLSGAPTPAAEETPAEEEKPKRGRAAKPKAEEPAKEPEPVKEPEPAIRATPEDRQPEPIAEDPQVVTGEVVDAELGVAREYTRDDVKAALGAYAEKFGMAQAASEGVKLMGAPRISALPEDPAAFAAAVKALNEAVARG